MRPSPDADVSACQRMQHYTCAHRANQQPHTWVTVLLGSPLVPRKHLMSWLLGCTQVLQNIEVIMINNWDGRVQQPKAVHHHMNTSSVLRWSSAMQGCTTRAHLELLPLCCLPDIVGGGSQPSAGQQVLHNMNFMMSDVRSLDAGGWCVARVRHCAVCQLGGGVHLLQAGVMHNCRSVKL